MGVGANKTTAKNRVVPFRYHLSRETPIIPFDVVVLPIFLFSRLYWYRGVTVLLPGWVIWKQMWFVHAKLPIGRWTGVRTIDPHGENGSNPLLTLTLTTITSMQIQNKKASTTHHVHFTMQPPSKITVCKMYSCQYLPVKIIKNKKSGICHQIFIFLWFYAGFELVLTRKMSFYVVTYYLPSGLFVIVSWIREHQIIDQKSLGVAHGPNIYKEGIKPEMSAFLKNLTSKGICRNRCLFVWGLLFSYDPYSRPPPPLHNVYVCTIYLFTKGRGGGGERANQGEG